MKFKHFTKVLKNDKETYAAKMRAKQLPFCYKAHGGVLWGTVISVETSPK